MEEKTLEQVIREYVHFPSSPNPEGWYPIVHPNCDHGKKGPRAAFNFSDGMVAFHCFNCGVSTKFNPDENHSIPYKLNHVLNDFGIPEDEIKQINFSLLGKNPSKPKQQKQHRDVEPEQISLPQTFYYLKNASDDDKWAQVAIAYLQDRGIDPYSYPFMLSQQTNNRILDRWCKRVIIPIYKQEKLIFYQGRDLTGKAPQKYLSPSTRKERVLYGFEHLKQQTHRPLYVTEGWFDAFTISGVALFGSEITPEQRIWLNSSPRQKVIIPDRSGDGGRLGQQALKFGWSISTPEIGSCKDISQAINKYGLLYIIKSISEHTYKDHFEGMTALSMYCE